MMTALAATPVALPLFMNRLPAIVTISALFTVRIGVPEISLT